MKDLVKILSKLNEKLIKLFKSLEIIDYGFKYPLDPDKKTDYLYISTDVRKRRATITQINNNQFIKVFLSNKKNIVIIRIEKNINPLFRNEYDKYKYKELSEEEKKGIIAKEFNVDLSVVIETNRYNFKKETKTLII